LEFRKGFLEGNARGVGVIEEPCPAIAKCERAAMHAPPRRICIQERAGKGNAAWENKWRTLHIKNMPMLVPPLAQQILELHKAPVIVKRALRRQHPQDIARTTAGQLLCWDDKSLFQQWVCNNTSGVRPTFWIEIPKPVHVGGWQRPWRIQYFPTTDKKHAKNPRHIQ